MYIRPLLAVNEQRASARPVNIAKCL